MLKHSLAPAFPVFLRLEGKRVLVVGAGPVAREKAARLIEGGALVRVVAPDARSRDWSRADDVRCRGFEDEDLAGVWFAIAAATPEVNRRVRAAADACSVFVVAVDDVESCSAFGAAQLDRGGVTIALSSNGRAPALVALLRQALDALIPDDLARWRQTAEHARAEWRALRTPMASRRPLLLAALNALYAEGSP